MSRGKSVRLLTAIPPKFAADFMERFDLRTTLGKAVLERHQTLLTDLGGEEALSSVKRSLVKRFIWLEAAIEGIELRAASGEAVDVGSWTQLCNSWLGIARMLGMERRARRTQSLPEYLAAQGRRSARAEGNAEGEAA